MVRIGRRVLGWAFFGVGTMVLASPVRATEGGTGASSLAKLVEVGRGGHLVARKEIRVRSWVVGAEPEGASGWNWRGQAYWVRGCENGEWEQAFWGEGDEMDPREVRSDFMVSPGQRVDLAARGLMTDSWNSHRWTVEASDKVTTLGCGDPLPIVVFGGEGGVAPDHLARFVGRDRTAILAANQLLYLFELGEEGHPGHRCDFRDLAVLVEIDESNAGEEGPVDGGEGAAGEQEGVVAAKGSLSGIDPDEDWEELPPLTISLAGLGPRTSTCLRVYPGTAVEKPKDVVVLHNSCVVAGEKGAPDRSFTLRKLDRHVRRHGQHTLELVHEGPHGTLVLASLPIRVDRTFDLREPFILVD